MPKRIQRKRTKGWRMPEGAVYVGRWSKWGNPFRVGGYFMIGDPYPKSAGAFRLSWCEASREVADTRFTKIDTREMAVEWYRKYMGLIYLTPRSIIDEI